MSDLRRNRRTRRAIEIASVITASLALHSMGLIAIGVRELPARDLMFRGDDGENGRRGAGGTSEFSVETPPPPPTVASTPAPAAAPTPQPEPAAPVVVRQPRPQPRPQPPSIASTPTPAPVAAPTPANPQTEPQEPSTPTSSGQRTGSVGEQRAMLPSAARCRDPVAGTWRAHKYNPVDHDWVIFTLRINRLPDNRLQGSIHSRSWSGYSMMSRPPGRCDGLLHDFDYLVRMPAQGALTLGHHVTFSAITYAIERAFCASAYFSYNPDAFSGDIDEARQEFQSVNNDGGRDQNAPYVFRRIGCLPGDVAPANTAAPSPVAATADGGSVAR